MPIKKRKTPKRAAKKKVIRKTSKKNVRKIHKKKPIIKRPAKAKKIIKKPKEKENIVGIVTHYFPKVRAAVIKLKAALSVGDSIKIKGHTTDFTQNVNSMQIDRTPIEQAKKGQEIGILVESRARQHDTVYKI